jgi:hypothetical protein
MVMVLAPAAKETAIKEMPKTKDNSNGKRNRFIFNPLWKVFSVIPYMDGASIPRRIIESNAFYERE